MPMDLIYWLVPLFVLAVVIAVIPVLLGTVRHENWEKDHLALQKQQLAELYGDDSGSHSNGSEVPLNEALQRAKSDALELVSRIEHLTERVDRHTVSK